MILFLLVVFSVVMLAGATLILFLSSPFACKLNEIQRFFKEESIQEEQTGKEKQK